MIPKNRGFTVVELLIVIAVVAILAAITVVSYNHMQARSRDAARVNDLDSIAKALQIYHLDNANYIQTGSGCGGNGNGDGWFNHVSTTYPKSIMECLTPYTEGKVIADPSGSTSCSGLSCHAYMKYSCSSGTFLYANLEAKPHSSTDTDGTCNSTADTSYGMNYYIKVD